jgi:hypothetical protein
VSIHRIRLRDPWAVEPHGDGLRYRRRFGQPTNLDSTESVWLTLSDGPVRVWINDRWLGESDGATEFEVTTDLALRNELIVETGPSGFGEAALEIRTGRDGPTGGADTFAELNTAVDSSERPGPATLE